MRLQTKHAYHRAVMEVIRHVAASPAGRSRLADLVSLAGFSRFHFTRLFSEIVGEHPSDFVGRIAMERAAYRLAHEGLSVPTVAREAGYSTPEAFGRAFRAFYGCSPASYRGLDDPEWRLRCASEVHWQPGGCIDGLALPDSACPALVVVLRPPQLVALAPESQRGDADAWLSVAAMRGGRSRGLIRLLGVRDRVGYVLEPHELAPAGFDRVVLPEGPYVAARRFVPEERRAALWRQVHSQWLPSESLAGITAFEELECMPGKPLVFKPHLLLCLDRPVALRPRLEERASFAYGGS